MTLLLFCLLANEWQWPITTEFGLSSSFGEYRGSRFHMGFDFSTNNVEGEPIKPAKAGTVFRIVATRTGYGRVIYIKHDQGYSTVYAHLAAFGPKLKAALKEQGKNPDAYFGTLQVDVPVAVDDLVAYSGESGAGSPHLHFEIRRNNEPVSPLALDFPPLADYDRPARIGDVYLVPLDADATVNNSRKPFLVGKGVNKVRASGRIGVQAMARIDGFRSNRLGCRAVRLHADGDLIGEWKPHQLSFDQYRAAGLVYDQAFSGFGPTRFAHCFDNRSAFLQDVPGYRQTQVVTVADEPVVLKIEAQNLGGVWVSRTLTLDPKAFRQNDNQLENAPIQATTLEMTLTGAQLFARSDSEGKLVTPDAIQGIAGGKTLTIPPLQPGDSDRLAWRTAVGNLSRDYGMLPQKKSYQFTLGRWSLSAKNIPVLPPVAVLAEPPDPKIRKDVLDYHRTLIRFGRHGFPTRGLTIRYDMTDIANAQQWGLYSWSFNKKRWRYLGKPDKGAALNHLAPVVLARDLVPPTIGKPRIHPYFTGERVVIPIRDKGSGVDRSTVTVSGPNGRINGEYDGDRAWVILPRQEKTGPWTVTVKDRAGRATTARNLRR